MKQQSQEGPAAEDHIPVPQWWWLDTLNRPKNTPNMTTEDYWKWTWTNPKSNCALGHLNCARGDGGGVQTCCKLISDTTRRAERWNLVRASQEKMCNYPCSWWRNILTGGLIRVNSFKHIKKNRFLKCSLMSNGGFSLWIVARLRVVAMLLTLSELLNSKVIMRL